MKRPPVWMLVGISLLCFVGLLRATLPQILIGSWTAASSLSQARSSASAVLLPNGSILLTGGDSGSGPLQSAELFGTDGTVSSAGAMNIARSKHFAVVLSDGRVLVGGGLTSGGGTTNAAEIYDPSANSWTQINPLTQARANATAALLQDGRMLIAGGDNGGNATNSIEIYDPSSGNFTFAGTLSSARTQHAMAVLQDGRVLIVGGTDGTNPLASSDIFDPVAGTVSAGPNLATARYNASATTLLGGQVAVIGGAGIDGSGNKTDLASTEIFDPTAGAFSTVSATLTTAREAHQAFLLPNNNNVLITGGTSGGAALASAELFSATASLTSGAWSYTTSVTGTMTTARAAASGSANQQNGPTSKVPPTPGLVIVGGGTDANGNTLASTEAYGYPTIQTDQGDYPPGTTVNITGSGFTPGETVTITLVESPLIDTHGPYTVTADGNGNVTDASFTTDQHDVDVRFWLSAAGTSGRQAQNTFTDNTNVKSATVNTFTSQSANCTATQSSTFTEGQTVWACVDVTALAGSGKANPFFIVWFNPSGTAVQTTQETTPSSTPAFFNDSLATGSSSTPSGSWTVKVCQSNPCTGGNVVASQTFTLNTLGTTTTVTSSADPSTYGTPPTFTAKVIPASGSTSPTGTVQFKINGTPIGSGVSVGACSPPASPDVCATFTPNNQQLQAIGSPHTIAAVYSGDAVFSTSTGSVSQTVSPMAVTVTGITVESHVYDGTTAATLNFSGAALQGVLTGDTVTLNSSSYTATFASRNVANGVAVTVSGLSLSGAQAGDYTLTQPTGLPGNITPKGLTYSGVSVPSSKVYDGTTTAVVSGTAALQSTETAGTGTTSDGKPYGVDSVSLTGTPSATYNSKDVATAATVTFGGISLTGTGNGNYTLTALTQAATITPKALTYGGLSVPASKIYDGTTNAVVSGTATLQTAETAGTGTTSDGKPYTGDTVSMTGTPTATYNSKDVPTANLVTFGGVSLTGSNSSNYTLAASTQAATITAKPLIYTGLSANNKVYDATTTATLTGTAALQSAESAGTGSTSDGTPYTGDAVSISGTASGIFASKDVASGINVTVSGLSLTGAQAADYSLTTTNLTANIMPKALTYTGVSVPASKTYDGTTAAVASGTAALQAAEAAGGSTSDGRSYTGDSVSLTGTATASYNSKDVAAATIVTFAGLSLTGTNSGDYTLTATTQAATITPKSLTYTGLTAPTSKPYDGATTVVVSGTATLQSAEAPGTGTTFDGIPYNVDSVSVAGTPSASYNSKDVATANLVTFAGESLTGIGNSNYSLTTITQAATITPKTITVTGITVQNHVYDGTTTALLNFASAMLQGVVSGDTVSLNSSSYTATFASKNVSSGVVVTVTGLILSGAQAGDYTLTQPALTGNITARPLTVTATGVNKQYDGTTTATVTLADNRILGDSITDSYTSATFADPNAGTGKTVTVTGISISGMDAGNYALQDTTTTTTANISQEATSTMLTSSQNPSIFTQSVTFTATVTVAAGTPTGTVQFFDQGVALGSPVALTASGGMFTAAFSTSSLSVGNHSITAVYSGDNNFTGSTSNTILQNVINPATTTMVTSSANPSVVGQLVTVTATVMAQQMTLGTPTGTVQFSIDGVNTGGPVSLVSGSASFSTSGLALGSHTIAASYVSDTFFASSSGAVLQTVNQASTTTAVTSSANPSDFGQAVTFTATVTVNSPGSGTPTGSVNFFDGGSQIGTGTLSVVGGVDQATFTTSSLSAGTHSINATYLGDTNFTTSTSTAINQMVARSDTTTTLTVSTGSSTLGDTVTLTAAVADATQNSTGTPTGLVTFFDNGMPIGVGILSGGASDQTVLTTAVLAAGTHQVTAAYDSDQNFNPSTSTATTETVNVRTSATTVTLNPSTVVVGQYSMVTATVTDSGTNPPGTADQFASTGAPATGTTGSTATLFADGMVLVAGGKNAGGTVVNSAYVYSGGTLTATGNLTAARTGATATSLPNGKILVAGGSSDGTAASALSTAELYDPAAGTFAVTSNTMTAMRLNATATLLGNGKVLIAGGENSSGALNTAELYDPASDTFTATGNLNDARSCATATLLISGQVLIAGGKNGSTVLNSAELYDANAGTFTPTGSLNTARTGATATLLVSGKVLAAGGSSDGTAAGALNSAELFDPNVGTFTLSGSKLTTNRYKGTATLLANSIVLLVGGDGATSAELYDAEGDKFTSTGSLAQADKSVTATLLNNGDVLVVGLTTGGAADAELYAPSFDALGKLALTSSDTSAMPDVFGGACQLAIQGGGVSACATQVTPGEVGTSPHTITASYPADAVHSTSSGMASLTVNKADTTTSTASSTNPSVFGQPVTFTVTVSVNSPGAGLPTGTVNVYDGGTCAAPGSSLATALSLSGGAASFSTSTLSAAASPHPIFACYNGDSNFNKTGVGSSVSTSVSQQVSPAPTSTAVSSSANPSIFGQAVMFTAAVTNASTSVTPTGSVQFVVDGTPFGSPVALSATGTATSAPIATLSVSGSPHSVTANYVNTDGNFTSSSGVLTPEQTVNKAPTATTVTSSLNPAVYGELVTFTATVANTAGAGISTVTPTGSVQFVIDGTAFGSPVSLTNGTATISTSALTVTNSPHTITVNYYNSDQNFQNSSGTLAGGQNVTPAPLTITASTASMIYGGAVPPITASYNGFVNGETASNLTTQPSCGTTAMSLSSVSGNPYMSSCMGAVDPNYTFTYVTGIVTVMQASTTVAVTVSPNPATFMQLVTITATVTPQFSGVPTGTVTFYNNGSSIGTTTLSASSCGTPPCPDEAVLAISSLPDNTTDNITATYGGDPNFTGSTTGTAVAETVQPAPVVSLSPMAVSFGNQNVNTSSKGAQVKLTNIGDANLNISNNGISITGSNANEFSETSNCGSTVAPNNGSCIITIVFRPVDTGVATASLQVTDNDDDSMGAQQTVSLTGAGLSTISGTSLYTDSIFATTSNCGALTLSGGSTVDSFNSAQGYSSSHVLNGGNVGTNGNITLNGRNSEIFGSAAVDSTVSGNCTSSSVTGLTSNGGAEITGGLIPLNGPITYPTPPAPSPAPPTTTWNITSCPSGMTGCTNTGSKTVSLAPGQYGNVTASGGTTVHVGKGTYNFNSLTLSGKSILYVDSGPVIVNLAGASLSGGSPAMDVTGGSIENPSGIPANLQFSYAGSRGINLSGGSGSYATVYAPRALVNMSGGTDFFGSIIGGTVTNSGGTAVHYDNSLPDIKAGNYIWFTAVVNNVSGLPSNQQVKLYLANSSISFTAGGILYTLPVPNGVVTFNSAALGSGAMTTYDSTNNRWSTSVSPKGLTGNTFVAGLAFPVPSDFPTGIQDVTWSAAFSTDTQGISLQWQWGAAVYSSFNSVYAVTGNNNVVGVNPEDGSADTNGTDPAGTPEAFKNYLTFGGTGGGLNNYTGYLSPGAGVVPTIAPMSVSPSSLDFGGQTQGTTSTTPMTAVLTNNDSNSHNLNSIAIGGANLGDFTLVPNSASTPNNCAGTSSLGSGVSCTLYVTFTPSDIGTRTAKIVINDDANNNPQTVYLTGTGQ